jgi:FtsH-binding integral membrane protein
MAAQNEPEKPRRIYFAGAYIAFGIAFLGVEFLGLIFGVSPADQGLQANLHVVIIGFYLLGGIVSGFLVAKRSQGDRIQAGTVTGVLAYIILQVVHAVLYGWGSIGDVYTMIALIGGSVAGSMIYDSQARRLAKARDAARSTDEKGGSGDSGSRDISSVEGDKPDEEDDGKPLD